MIEETASGPPDFYVNAWKQYRLQEEFDPSAYEITHPEQYDLVSVVAGIDIEPRVERNYWVLQVRIRDTIGLRRILDEHPYRSESGMKLDTFKKQFLSPPSGDIGVRVLAETRAAKDHFDAWLARFKAKHMPGETSTVGHAAA